MRPRSGLLGGRERPRAASSPEYHPINSYGMIGDLHTVALVNPEGGIDWCCAPYLDSASVFGATLDARVGGTFRISPRHFERSHMRYLSRTNILETTFESGGGSFVLTDFMPIQSEHGHKDDPERVLICRQIECLRGSGETVEICFQPRPDYGRKVPKLEYGDRDVVCTSPSLSLHSEHAIEWGADGVGRLRLSQGDTATFLFCFGESPKPSRLDVWYDREFFRTRAWWEDWIGQSLYRGRWRRAVERSALALKLMIFRPTGAIAAAPTTSLPEALGGERNWDYRYSWLRDSAFTLNALFVLGFRHEAMSYMKWLVEHCFSAEGELKILYPIRPGTGEDEEILEHLEGYKGSRPVRIGNAAAEQFQLDVYGEVLESLFLYSVYAEPIDDMLWEGVVELAEKICARWREADEGIWEVRSGRANFTHSKLLSYVGLDRAARIAGERGAADCEQRWRTTRDQIYDYVLGECVDPEGGYLTQSREVRVPDASTLMGPILGAPAADHPVVAKTIEAVREHLTRNRLVYRYHAEDGLSGQEGTFNLCTFWLVEALAMAGRTEEALATFHRILDVASPVGLFAEETDPDSLEALGNFPQAFTHLGLINAALVLNRMGHPLG